MVGEAFDAHGAPAGLRGTCTVAADLFGPQAAGWIAHRLVRVLEVIAGDPDTRLSEVDVLDAAERRQVLETWNDTATPVPALTVLDQFVAQAARTPGAPALVYEGAEVSFAELDTRANRLARYLHSAGVEPESVVGLCLPRGIETVAAIVGVWKAGAAYLPVDAGYPAERIRYMLADARAAVLIATVEILDNLPTGRIRTVAVDDPMVVAALAAQPDDGPAVELMRDHLAYVIYTSGSTGWPKGVTVTHGGSNHCFIRGGVGSYGGRYLVCQARATDVGNMVVFASLATGGVLHILDADAAVDPAAVSGYLTEHRIDFLKAVPSHLAALAAVSGMEGVLPARALLLGGEAALTGWVGQLLGAAGDRLVFNHYGPTETTIGVVVGLLDPDVVASGQVPLGTPIANTRAYVLDGRLTPAPPAVAGELYVAGEGLARGSPN